MSENIGGAYGAGKAGAPFDPIAFLKKPQVILRAVSWLFSIIVFACISSKGWIILPVSTGKPVCYLNANSGACQYGVAIGVIAFLAALVFLILDALFDQISSVQQRKYVVIGDMVFSAAWAFLWFVGFCFMVDQWRRTDIVKQFQGKTHGVNDIQAAIAFSFFSIFTWGGLAFFAVRKYQLGSQDAFTSGYEPDPNATSPYSSFPGSETGEPYQQPPFAPQKDSGPGYNAPPTY